MARAQSSTSFLYVDPSTAGISGNMLVGALLDALPANETAHAVKRFKRVFRRKGFRLDSAQVARHGFRGFYIDGTELDLDTHDLGPEVRKASKALGLAPAAQRYAESVVELIVSLEAEVHGVPRDHVHLHELAGYDTVFDAVGGAFALSALGVLPGGVVYSRPVEVGSGRVTFSHGTTAVPPPVSELILHRFRIPFTQHADREVATPTGLAMLAQLHAIFAPPPASVMAHRGVGAGKMELPDRANLLHVQIRERIDGSPTFPVHDPVAQLDVNLDDVTGEEAGHALSRVLEEGALDAHLVHTLAKKGRPGYVLTVLAREEDAAFLADLMGSTTGSWGVRISHRVLRFKRVPQETTVRVSSGASKRTYPVRVKYIRDDGGFVRVKAEHDDVAAASKASGERLADVRDRAEDAVKGKRRRRPPR